MQSRCAGGIGCTGEFFFWSDLNIAGMGLLGMRVRALLYILLLSEY